MRILIVSDAWRPQVNGVVRTLERLALDAGKLGHTVEFLTPQDYPTAPLPGYPEIQLALATPQAVADAIEAHNPDALHISTEGPLGWLARHWSNCVPIESVRHSFRLRNFRSCRCCSNI